jgi:hypothetical protein
MVFLQVIQFPGTECIENSDRVAEELYILLEVLFLFLQIVKIAKCGIFPPREKNEIPESVSPFFPVLFGEIRNPLTTGIWCLGKNMFNADSFRRRKRGCVPMICKVDL